jgi:SulP family sulfate permease
MAGVLLIVAAISGLGGHIHRIPTAVIEGFTAGIAVVIALQQVPTMLGLKIEPADHVWETAWLALKDWASMGPVALSMGVACATAVILGQRFGNKVPVALVCVALASLLATGFGWQVDKIGDLPNLIRMPSGDFLLGVNLWPLLPSAVAVATLAALESLLSAKVADNLAKSPRGHDSNRELFGQGLANLVVPFFGGVPATAALARTAVNVKSHARSRLSAASHSVFLATAVLALPNMVSEVPLPALAGVLVGTAVKMIHFRELITLARRSKLDAILLVCTFAVTVALDLISAVVAGVLIFWLLRNTKLSIKTPQESDLD